MHIGTGAVVLKVDVCEYQISFDPVALSGGITCDGTEEHLSDCTYSHVGTCGVESKECAMRDEMQYNVVGLMCTSKLS